MKSRSQRLPINEPPDDWGDGSWTVDCVCGVNFDDGEEMVNCDECGIWVHTRCSRFMKGDASFSCDKCKSKKNRNDNEEEVAQLLVELPNKTMTMNNPCPPPAPSRSSSLRLWTEIPIEERVHVQGVPGGDPSLFQGLSSVFTSELWKCSGYVPKKFNFKYKEFPCWDEKTKSVAKIDEESEKVDRGADALFSLSKEIVSASPVEVLVGLRSSVKEGVSHEKKPSKKEGKKRESNDLGAKYMHNSTMREADPLRPSGLHLGKRKKDSIRSNDVSGKKKARSASREVDGKTRVSTTAIGAQQLVSLKVGESKLVETGFEDSMNGDKTTLTDPHPDACTNVSNNRPKENLTVNVHFAGESLKKAKRKDALAADIGHPEDSSKKAKHRDTVVASTDDSSMKLKPKVSLEVNAQPVHDSFKKGKSKDKLLAKSHYAEVFSKKVKPKDNIATNPYNSEDTSKEVWSNSSLVEIVVKSENDHQAPMRTGNSSETVAVEVSLLEPTGISTMKKHEDYKKTTDGFSRSNDEKHAQGDLNGNSSNTALSSPKLKLPLGDSRNVSSEVLASQVIHDLNESMSPRSSRPCMKIKTEGNADQPKGNSSALSSTVIDVKLDSTEPLDQQPKLSVSEQPYEKFQEHETHTSTFSCDEVALAQSKALSRCDKNNIIEGMIPISGEPCQTKELIGSAGTLSVQERSSELKHLKLVEEPSKEGGISPSPPSPLTQHKVVPGFGKSSSSTVVISKSEVSGSCKPPGRPASPSTLRPIHFSRVKTNSYADIKKNSSVQDAAKDDIRHEESRKTAREQLKAPVASTSKPSHMSKTSHASISKHTSLDSKESVLYSSSKGQMGQNATVSSSSIEATSTLQPESVSHVQNKTTASGLCEKVERSNQLGPSQPSKVTQPSSMHHPPPVSTLSDEELALLLHHELNSSPRVPRVPRVRHAGSIPQLGPSTATNMLIKRTSSSGMKDHMSVVRRKVKEEATKDGSRNPRELIDETKKINGVLHSFDHQKQDQVVTSDGATKTAVASNGATKRETFGGSTDVGNVKKNAPHVSITAPCQSSSAEAIDQNLSSFRNSPRNTSDEDDGDDDDDDDDNDNDDEGGIAGPATRTLPGLLDEIMSKGRRMTYEELCNAVLPHWNSLRKQNGERYAYSSHSQAVLDCLRNRNEWAQLVDRGPKTNAGRKKRKLDSELPQVESEENGYSKSRTPKGFAGKAFEAHPEDFPKGKRKARKRRRLALQGRGIRDVRKRQNANAVTNDDLGPFSHSSDNGGAFSEDSQGARTRPNGSEASSSFEEAGSL